MSFYCSFLLLVVVNKINAFWLLYKTIYLWPFSPYFPSEKSFAERGFSWFFSIPFWVFFLSHKNPNLITSRTIFSFAPEQFLHDTILQQIIFKILNIFYCVWCEKKAKKESNNTKNNKNITYRIKTKNMYNVVWKRLCVWFLVNVIRFLFYNSLEYIFSTWIYFKRFYVPNNLISSKESSFSYNFFVVLRFTWNVHS